jgi:hypothetical protein
MLLRASLILFPALIAAAPHNRPHSHRHTSPTHSLTTLGPSSLARRDPPLNIGNLPRLSDENLNAISQTCAFGASELPLNPGVPNPVDIPRAEQLSLFPRPNSTPDTLTLHNYCAYELYWSHYNGPAGEHDRGVLPAGGEIRRPLDGTVMKVSKTADMARDVLVEYSTPDDGPEDLWYNLSLITCLGRLNGKVTADVSGCAGHEAGLQVDQTGGFAFQCEAGTWCDDQAYFYGVSPCPFALVGVSTVCLFLDKSDAPTDLTCCRRIFARTRIRSTRGGLLKVLLRSFVSL